MKKFRRKNREPMHPLMSYVLLIVIVMVLSGILHLVDASSAYNSINNITLDSKPITEFKWY